MALSKTALEELRRARLLEAKTELAERFLEEGLLRNAAGRVFQAWKAAVSALSITNLDLLEEIRGEKKVHGKKVKLSHWLAAVAPTSRLAQLCGLLEARAPGLMVLNALALDVHEYQYNGPDPEGLFSKYPNDDVAKIHIQKLITEIKRLLTSAELAQ